MPTIEASGTQTTIIGTEHELANLTANKFYYAHISLKNMGAGDTLQIRKYIKILSTSTEDVFMESLSGVQDETVSTYKYQAPEASTQSYRLTVKHTVGSPIDIDWAVYSS